MTKKDIFKYIDTVYNDIKTIKIQGATNIAIAGIHAITFAVASSEIIDKDEFFDFLDFITNKIKSARPTEPMLFNGINYIVFGVRQNKEKTLKAIIKACVSDGKNFLKLIQETSDKSIEYGSKLIKNGNNVLTHCHSSSVVKTFVAAKNKGVKFHVFNTETRPLYQGRLTSADLVKNGIDNTMVVDSEASYLISDASGKDYVVNKVIIGCDAIGMSGSVINKVGSFGIALACYISKVPLYISANLLKVDVLGDIPVESRDFKELWEDAPKGLNVLNFAFDLVPAKYITGFITEFGIISPKDIKKIAKEKYHFMFIK